MSEFIDKVALIYVNDENKVLVVRTQGKEVFYVPGGRREGDESDSEVLKRELKEEIDIDFDVETMQFLGEYSAEAHDRPGIMVVTRCYSGEFSGEIKPSSEIEELLWLSVDEVESERVSPASRAILVDLRQKGIFGK